MNLAKNLLRLLVIFGTLSPSVSLAFETAFEPDDRLPVVYINAAIRVGAVTDPVNQAGLTNFMGEMLLRGTKSRTKEQIDLALDQMGAKLDVETRAEAFILRGAVLASQLEPYLRLVTEILTQPKFPESEIKKLKAETVSVIEEELGHDSSLASRRFNRYLFQGHPYGKPVIGKTKDINALTKAQILAHYNRLVQDKFLLVVGTGDASVARITKWAEELAKYRPNTPLNTEDSKILALGEAPKDFEKRKLLIIDKPERTQTQIFAGQIGVRLTNKDYFPLYLGNHAFGGSSFSAILMDEIRVKRGWSYGANSSFRHGLQPRSWVVHLFPAEKDTAPALAYTLKLIESLQTNGISKEQFQFAKQSLINSSGFMYNTPKKRVENRLLERILELPTGFMQSYSTELEKVQFSDVNAAFKNFLKPDQMAIAVLGTADHLKESLSKAAGVPIEKIEVVPYTSE